MTKIILHRGHLLSNALFRPGCRELDASSEKRIKVEMHLPCALSLASILSSASCTLALFAGPLPPLPYTWITTARNDTFSHNRISLRQRIRIHFPNCSHTTPEANWVKELHCFRLFSSNYLCISRSSFFRALRLLHCKLNACEFNSSFSRFP